MTPETVFPGTIEAWLTRDTAESHWTVVNARLKYPRHGERIMPDGPQPIAEVFCADIAEVLDHHLGCVKETAVFSLSDFSLCLPGLHLDGLRVLTRIAPDGSGSANVRFVRAVGDLGQALADKMRNRSRAAPGGLDDIALPVLQDLLRPALEVFDHILENGLSEADTQVLAARVKTMRARRDELSDYILLLSRVLQTNGDSARKAVTEGAAHRLPDQVHGSHDHDVEWDPVNGTVRGGNATVLHGHHAKLAG